MVMTLAGRRPDPEDAEFRRFPIANAVAVRERIRALLTRTEPRILISSAACGADLLGQDVARDLGLESHIVLPFAPDRFRDTSVVDRPGHWGELYDRIIDEAKSDDQLVILQHSGGDRPYALANQKILTHSKRLASPNELLSALVVWDGKPKDSDDFTDQLGKQVTAEGGNVYEVQTLL